MTFTNRRYRTAFYAVVLLLPVLTVWNLVAAAWWPTLRILLGPRLSGIVQILPLEWSVDAFHRGDLQKALTSRVTAAFPLQPILVRINNEIRMGLFGETSSPSIVRGTGGELVEQFYTQAYCGITPDLAASRAKTMIPLLRDLQDYYKSRGAIFLYVLSPSKAAHMPDVFPESRKCLDEPARARLAADYAKLLREAGIAVTDTASLIHGLKPNYTTGLFPRGGLHWNEIGLARATQAVIAEINRQAGSTLVPPFEFTYAMTNKASGEDRDLVDVVNMLFPRLAYPTPKVSYQRAVACDTSQAPSVDAAIVGSSFMSSMSALLISEGCLRRLNYYFYLWQARHGGEPMRQLKANLTESDYAPLRDARLMIVEENEAFLNRPAYYVEALHRYLFAR